MISSIQKTPSRRADGGRAFGPLDAIPPYGTLWLLNDDDNSNDKGTTMITLTNPTFDAFLAACTKVNQAPITESVDMIDAYNNIVNGKEGVGSMEFPTEYFELAWGKEGWDATITITPVTLDAKPAHDTVTPVTDTASKETLIKSIERPDDMLSYRDTDSLERIEQYRLMNIAARTPTPRKVDMDGTWDRGRPRKCGLAYTHYIGTSHTEAAGIKCRDIVYLNN